MEPIKRERKPAKTAIACTGLEPEALGRGLEPAAILTPANFLCPRGYKKKGEESQTDAARSEGPVQYVHFPAIHSAWTYGPGGRLRGSRMHSFRHILSY